MDIIAIAVALKNAISQTKDIIASHFVAGTNIEITDNPDGTQTINASGEASATDEVARQAISDHKADLNNPHSVTKNQIGLGNVDNTSDADKPISTATQAALNSKQDTISDLSTIRSNATAGAGAATVVQGIDETGNNYIELKSGQREYLDTIVPTGNIPIGSMGMGFDEGVLTYKSGAKVSEGEPTANEFTGDISQFDNQGGTGNTYNYFKLTGDYTITLTCKDDCTSPTGITIGLNAEGGVATGGFTTLVTQRGNYTQGQIITGKTSDNGYQYVCIYGGSTTLEWIVEHFDIMLNKGNTALPYEPYGAKQFPFYANGQSLADYTIYGADGGVGDITAQLFDASTATQGRIIWATGAATSDDEYLMSDYIPVEVGKTYTCSTSVWFIGYDSNDTYLGTYNEGEWDKNGLKNATTFVNSATLNAAKIRLLKRATSLSSVMLNSGTTALPYEPYGKYKIPVICGNTTTNIYVDSPLDDGDSIDYATAQVTIPTVDGANNLICDTTVQPSKVSLTYTGWHSDIEDIRTTIGDINSILEEVL